MALGNNLKNIRTKKGLSQRGLALKCKHVSYATISRIEAGKVIPSIDTVKELATALNVGIGELMKPNVEDYKLAEEINKNEPMYIESKKAAKPLTLERIIAAMKEKNIDDRNLNKEQIELITAMAKSLSDSKKQ